MSAEGEQQRRPGAPDDTDGRRRLRTVSYPDPFLVTKLPLEGMVNSGVIRLGERMLLGFIHRPFPDGTRVRVVYDEWLFAERVDDEGEDDEPAAERGEDDEPVAERGEDDEPVAERGEDEGDETSGAKSARERASGAEAAGAKDSGSKAGAEKTSGAKAGSAKEPAGSDENGSLRGESSGASEDESTGNASADESRSKRFPEEFSDAESRANRELDSRGDAWTDTFARGNREK